MILPVKEGKSAIFALFFIYNVTFTSGNTYQIQHENFGLVHFMRLYEPFFH
jgi:hypothetical protein